MNKSTRARPRIEKKCRPCVKAYSISVQKIVIFSSFNEVKHQNFQVTSTDTTIYFLLKISLFKSLFFIHKNCWIPATVGGSPMYFFLFLINHSVTIQSLSQTNKFSYYTFTLVIHARRLILEINVMCPLSAVIKLASELMSNLASIFRFIHIKVIYYKFFLNFLGNEIV